MREARRFFRAQPDPTFRIHPDRDLRNVVVGEIFQFALVVLKGYPDPPISFSTRFGDALHNYRSALDHIAWQLVCHGSTPPGPLLDDRAQTNVQFPIYDTEVAFRNAVRARLPGADKTAIGFIETRHKYVGGQTTNDALQALASLSNDDKHRTLHIVTGIFETLENNVTATRCIPLRYENPPERPAVKDGAVVALAYFQVTGENPEIEMHLKPTIQIALEDGRDFTEILEVIDAEVTEILNAPEILAAVA
jgi:hypothetical protein